MFINPNTQMSLGRSSIWRIANWWLHQCIQTTKWAKRN